MNDQHLLAIARAGNEIDAAGTPTDPMTFLGVLIDLENVLDKGRGLTTDVAVRAQVNQLMEQLRSRIAAMMQSVDRGELAAFIADRSRAAGESWRAQLQ